MTRPNGELIQEGRRRAERRNEEWLEQQESRMDEETKFLDATWKYLVIPCAELKLSPKQLRERTKQFLEDHLKALVRG